MRVRKFLLGGFMAAFLCAISVAFSAISVAPVNAETATGSTFAPVSSSELAATITQDGSSELIEMKIDKTGRNSECGAYYTRNVNATVFETNFSITQFNQYGIMRIALLANKEEFPYPNRGNGIGLSFSTNGDLTQLTAVCRLFDVPDEQGTVQYENGEYIYEEMLVYDGASFLVQDVCVCIKETDDTNLTVFVRIGDVFKEWLVPKENLSTAFNYENCQYVLVPDYDQENNTDLSSANPIKVKVDSVSDANDFSYKYTSVYAAIGTASVSDTLVLPVSSTTTAENSSVYFKENLSIYSDAFDETQTIKKEVNITFAIDSFNAYGGLYIGFMSSNSGYPSNGDGAGVHLLDENGSLSLLSSKYYNFNGSEITNEGGDKNAATEAYIGKCFRLRAWDFSQDAIAIYIFAGNSFEEVNAATQPVAAGTITKVAGFDSSNCSLVITPTINAEQASSYANPIHLRIEKITNDTLVDNAPVFYNNATAEVARQSETISFDVAANTTAETASVHYKRHVNISNGFDMTFQLDSFNAYGGLNISFMSSANDRPGNGYGFGIYLLDEAAEGKTAFTSLGSDFYVFDGTQTTNVDDKRLVDGAEYRHKYFRLKVVLDAGGDLVIYPFVSDTLEGVKALTESVAQGELAEESLPAQFDYNNCILILTPTVDNNATDSYANDIRLTVEEMNGKTTLKDKIFATPSQYETETAMIDGASMRLKSTVDNSGIRFSMTMDYDLYKKIKHGATIGIIIAPQRKFGDGELTLALNGINNYAFQVDGDGVVVDEVNGIVTFNAVVRNVPVGNNTVLAARGYVIYGETYYTDYDAAQNCRSIRQVADVLWAGYKDGTLNYTDEEAAMIEKYITPVEQTV